MIKLVRLITYEFGSQEQLDIQMGRSMPDGIRDFGGRGVELKRIDVRTLNCDNKFVLEMINLYGGVPFNVSG